MGDEGFFLGQPGSRLGGALQADVEGEAQGGEEAGPQEGLLPHDLIDQEIALLKDLESDRLHSESSRSRLENDLVVHFGDVRNPGIHGRVADLLIEAGFDGDDQELKLLIGVIQSRMMSGGTANRGALSGLETYLNMMSKRGLSLPFYGTGLKQRAVNPNRGLDRRSE